MIQKPILAPKKGYVEIIDEKGRHIYKATDETERLLQQRIFSKNLQADTDGMLVDHEYRLTLMELGLQL